MQVNGYIGLVPQGKTPAQTEETNSKAIADVAIVEKLLCVSFHFKAIL